MKTKKFLRVKLEQDGRVWDNDLMLSEFSIIREMLNEGCKVTINIDEATLDEFKRKFNK